MLFVSVDGQADQKVSPLNASTHFRIILPFPSFKHKVGRENHRFIFVSFLQFQSYFAHDEAPGIDDFEGALSLERSDILSIYSVRVCFNLTPSGAERVSC